MRKFATLLLGIVTLWPLVDTVIFSCLWFSMMFAIFRRSADSDPTPVFDIAYRFQLYTAAVSIPILVFYIFHVFCNNHIERDKKFLWAIALFFGIPFTMPIYWYQHFWRKLPGQSPPAGS